MERQRRTALIVTMLVAAYLLLTTAVATLNEVPSLDDFPNPEFNFSMPYFNIPINPETTNLQAPELDLGNMDPEPLLSILGKTGTEYLRLQTYDDYYSGTWDTALTDSITYEGETLELNVDLWTDYNFYNITKHLSQTQGGTYPLQATLLVLTFQTLPSSLRTSRYSKYQTYPAPTR